MHRNGGKYLLKHLSSVIFPLSDPLLVFLLILLQLSFRYAYLRQMPVGRGSRKNSSNAD